MKTNASKHLVCWLKNSVSNFRNCYANEADHVTKSDLKSKTKIAAVIMKWLSQGIPFICWNVGIFLNTAIFTWITNLFIGYEDIYCQCMIFHHRASIWSISLLAVHPLISSTVRSDPHCAWQKRKKAARGVRFKSGLVETGPIFSGHQIPYLFFRTSPDIIGYSRCPDISRHVRRLAQLPKLTRLFTSTISVAIQLHAGGSK